MKVMQYQFAFYTLKITTDYLFITFLIYLEKHLKYIPQYPLLIYL